MNSDTAFSPVISAEDLLKELNNPKIKIFDVRGSWGSSAEEAFDEYFQGHIGSATYLDWTKYFVETNLPINLAPVASQKNAQFSFNHFNITSDDLVVLYDNCDHMMACRIWWAMSYWGFKNVRVLNGGWKRWQQLKLPVSKLSIPEVNKASNNEFPVSEEPNFKISFDQFLEKKDSAFLIDARGIDKYNGDPNDPFTGHIPGAINLPFRFFLDEQTGLLKSASEIEAIFYKYDPEFKRKPIIVSCGAGYAASVVFLALKMIDINSRLFDDSFSVWKTKANLPIEQN